MNGQARMSRHFGGYDQSKHKVELGGNRDNNRRRKLHKRIPFNILRGVRDNSLTASVKAQQGAIERNIEKTGMSS